MGEENVAVLGGRQKEVLAAKKSVVELLLVVEKTRDVHVDAEKNVRSHEMELPLLKHREASFNRAMTAVNKELYAVRVECAVLRWNRD